jgi:hypothetical protein
MVMPFTIHRTRSGRATLSRMPPRYAYWTILIDGQPTAFRAREREELVPTLVQLRRTNPQAEMRWFASGRLWDSPEQAQWARRNASPPRERRDREWRPGGVHRDPRARFDKARRPKSPRPFAGPSRGDRPPGVRAESDRPRPLPPRAPRGSPPDSRPPGTGRPPGRPPGGQPPVGKPFDRKPAGGGKPSGLKRPDAARSYARKPSGGRPFGGSPAGSRPSGARPPAGRPPRGRPPSAPRNRPPSAPRNPRGPGRRR